MKHFFKYLTFLIAVAIISCDSNEEFVTENKASYLHLRKGAYQVYDVTETLYTLGQPETFKYELRMVVADSFLNAEGDYTYTIYRSKKNEGDENFTYLDTWSARTNSREIIVNEENTTFLKLKVPARENDQWDGNLYNALGEDLYSVTEVNASRSVNQITFEDCIVIEQNDNQDFVVALDQRSETYARGVGLIEKHIKQLSYCSVGPCLGQQQVESGVILAQTIKSYGIE